MKINILYWDNGDQQRLLNTNLSWHYLKNFAKYCNDNSCPLEPFLFDFSEVQVLPDAIHIPYPKGSYKRAEKINKVFEYHTNQENFIGICDSDVIIRDEDYSALKYLIQNFKKEKFYVFKVDDLISHKGVDFENKKINFSELEFKERNFEPDFGGLSIVNNRIFEKVGGFDTSIKEYGGEDNLMSYTLQDFGYKKVLLPIKPIHLLHESLYTLEYQKSPEYLKQLKKVLEHKNKGNYK